jgi:hypothetical protein
LNFHALIFLRSYKNVNYDIKNVNGEQKMVIATAERRSALTEFWDFKNIKSYFMKQETMTPTMTPTMGTANPHKDIPGNPSTSKSSNVRLSDRSNGKPLRVLSEADWKFWIHNG